MIAAEAGDFQEVVQQCLLGLYGGPIAHGAVDNSHLRLGQGRLGRRIWRGLDISPDLVCAVTDAVLDEVAEWQGHPLEAFYPLVFLDALRVKVRDEGTVRNKAIYVALGVRADGTKDVLGLWIEQTEGAKFWLRVMNELHDRGVPVRGSAPNPHRRSRRPEGLPRGDRRGLLENPGPSLYCPSHSELAQLVRSGLRGLRPRSLRTWKDRKAVAAALREIYRARNAEAGQAALDAFDVGPRGRNYPVIADLGGATGWR